MLAYTYVEKGRFELLEKPKRVIVCEKDSERREFVRKHYPQVLVTEPENVKEFVRKNSDHGGADVVIEAAGGKDTFRMAWECAEILELISRGKIDTTALITHTYALSEIEAAYELFENRKDHVIKVAVRP